jgi:hypothetical protein
METVADELPDDASSVTTVADTTRENDDALYISSSKPNSQHSNKKNKKSRRKKKKKTPNHRVLLERFFTICIIILFALLLVVLVFLAFYLIYYLAYSPVQQHEVAMEALRQQMLRQYLYRQQHYTFDHMMEPLGSLPQQQQHMAPMPFTSPNMHCPPDHILCYRPYPPASCAHLIYHCAPNIQQCYSCPDNTTESSRPILGAADAEKNSTMSSTTTTLALREWLLLPQAKCANHSHQFCYETHGYDMRDDVHHGKQQIWGFSPDAIVAYRYGRGVVPHARLPRLLIKTQDGRQRLDGGGDDNLVIREQLLNLGLAHNEEQSLQCDHPTSTCIPCQQGLQPNAIARVHMHNETLTAIVYGCT